MLLLKFSFGSVFLGFNDEFQAWINVVCKIATRNTHKMRMKIILKISNGIWTNVASNKVNGHQKNGNFWDKFQWIWNGKRFIGRQGGDRPPSTWHWCLGLVLPDLRPTEIGKFFEIVR